MMIIDNRIIQLRSQGHKNITVLAILATEMSFRPLGLRLLEYISVGLLGQARTIGIGQIHIRHWNSRGYFGVKAVLAALSPERNYKICEDIISKETDNLSTKELLSIYTGEVTQSYYNVFLSYLKFLKKMEKTEQHTTARRRTYCKRSSGPF